MSGICGLISLRGDSLLETSLKPVLNALKRQGPEGSDLYCDETAALGHALLATTPEAAHERLPFLDPDSECVITADVRLDNREELALALGLSLQNEVLGDGALILQAYITWGEHCTDHLLGAFAFAIWDPRSKRLFAARDHIGEKHLNYAILSDGSLAFASQPSAVRLFEHSHFPLRLKRVAEYLEDLEAIDKVSTFFEGLFRLPAAHQLVFDQDGLRVSEYWTIAVPPPLHLPNDQAYADAFLKVFTQAVQCRLRSVGPVASMLSGGMDSGSVAAVAARLLSETKDEPLLAFSAVSPDPENCEETRKAYANGDNPNIHATRIDHTALGPLIPELAQRISTMEEPFDDMVLFHAICALSTQAGAKILLNGGYGDMLFAGGDTAEQLARQGQFITLYQHARAIKQAYPEEPSAVRSVAAGIWRAFSPEILRTYLRTLRRQSRLYSVPTPSFLGPDLIDAVDWPEIEKRYANRYTPPVSPHSGRIRAIFNPNGAVGSERYSRIASQYGLEMRDPFMDIRLISFCLSLPPNQLESQGLTKLVLRNAMRGYVPDAVRCTLGKPHLGFAFSKAFFGAWTGWRTKLRAKDKLGIKIKPLDDLLAEAEAIETVKTNEQQAAIAFVIWLDSLD